MTSKGHKVLDASKKIRNNEPRSAQTKKLQPVLLIGAQKSGSSYLYNLLTQDPIFATAKLKEPKIFATVERQGLDFFSFFEISEQKRIAIDATTAYLHIACVAERAKKQLGSDTPIIAVLRDPVERAVSAYLHEVKHGRELRRPDEVFSLPTETSAKVIEAEAEAIDRAWRSGQIQPHGAPKRRYHDQFFQFRYVSNSLYCQQLAPWLHHFNDVRLIDFSSLKAEPDATLNKVRASLGLDIDRLHSLETSKNETRMKIRTAFVENCRLAYDFRRPSSLLVFFRLKSLISSFKHQKPTVPDQLGRLLRQEFDNLRKSETVIWL